MSASAEYPVSVRKRTTPKWFDLARLDELRTQHTRLHGEFRRAGESLRSTQAEMGQLRASLSGEPEAEELLGLPVEALAALSMDQLDEVKLDPRAIQKLIMLEKRTKTLQAEQLTLGDRVARSVAYMEQVERYATGHGL